MTQALVDVHLLKRVDEKRVPETGGAERLDPALAEGEIDCIQELGTPRILQHISDLRITLGIDGGHQRERILEWELPHGTH